MMKIKHKIFKIDGTDGYVMRHSGQSRMQYFWGAYITSDGMTEFSSAESNQHLMVMLNKNCVLHITTTILEMGKEFEKFVGTLFLVFSEDGKDKVTVLVANRDERGIADSFYFKLQHHDEHVLINLARELSMHWLKGTGKQLFEQAKFCLLDVKEKDIERCCYEE